MGKEPEPAGNRLEIKKYPNRRYYDLTHSRHLTLQEIRGLIQEGHDVHVTEAKSGSDITTQVLTQILLELDSARLDKVPASLLIWLIRADGQSMKEIVEKSFARGLKSFSDFQQQIEEQLRQSHGLPAPLPVIAQGAKALIAPLAAAFSGAATASAPEPERTGPGGSSEDLGELIRLKKEIEGIESEARKKSRKPKE